MLTVVNQCIVDQLRNKSSQSAFYPSYEMDDADWLRSVFFFF